MGRPRREPLAVLLTRRTADAPVRSIHMLAVLVALALQCTLPWCVVLLALFVIVSRYGLALPSRYGGQRSHGRTPMTLTRRERLP